LTRPYFWPLWFFFPFPPLFLSSPDASFVCKATVNLSPIPRKKKSGHRVPSFLCLGLRTPSPHTSFANFHNNPPIFPSFCQVFLFPCPLISVQMVIFFFRFTPPRGRRCRAPIPFLFHCGRAAPPSGRPAFSHFFAPPNLVVCVYPASFQFQHPLHFAVS